MTALKDGTSIKDQQKLRCDNCEAFMSRFLFCGNTESDHYCHKLAPTHPACKRILRINRKKEK